MMQFKSARGVQQADVTGAADALIEEGLRPTIERVRQKMGRGSPNTVSPMLDIWFSALGARLTGKQNTATADTVPHAVQEAMNKLWETALASGREEALLQVAQVRASLEGERMAIAARAADFAQQEQLQAERIQASEHALNATRMQIEDLRGQSADLRQSLKEREKELAEQRNKMQAAEQVWAAQAHKAADAAAQQVRERQRADERAASTEQRLLQEVDRVRQETKFLRVAALESEKREATQYSQWQQTLQTRADALSLAIEQGAQNSRDLQTARDMLTTARLKNEELKGLFDKQQLANESVIAQLTRALTTRPRLSTSSMSSSKNKAKLKRAAGRVMRP